MYLEHAIQCHMLPSNAARFIIDKANAPIMNVCNQRPAYGKDANFLSIYGHAYNVSNKVNTQCVKPITKIFEFCEILFVSIHNLYTVSKEKRLPIYMITFSI